MRAIIHLHGAEEDAELVVRNFVVKLCDDELEVIDPVVCEMEVLNEDPISCNDCLLNGFLNCLVESLTHLVVLQLLLGAARSVPLRVELFELLVDVD